MKALDLFCGAGGASVGLHRAGFEVTGVDIVRQPHYPFKFYQADALTFPLEGYDLIWASPPCQFASESTPIAHRAHHPNLIPAIRQRLAATGVPYIIENVENARSHLLMPVMLCGTMFGLPIWRHRYFEVVPHLSIFTPPCAHYQGPVTVMSGSNTRKLWAPVLCTGGGDGQRISRKTHRPREKVENVRAAMGIDWMGQKELTQAIPPAYSEFLGWQVIEQLKRAA